MMNIYYEYEMKYTLLSGVLVAFRKRVCVRHAFSYSDMEVAKPHIFSNQIEDF